MGHAVLMTALPELDLDAEALAAFARALAPDLRPGDTLLLDGPVGAGKSHFARALIRARMKNPQEEVPSPTFTLVQSYDDPAGVAIWHADLYRLGDASELDELGLTDAMEDAICLIEWPERMAEPPAKALWISLRDGVDSDRRIVTLSGAPSLTERAMRAAERAALANQAGWGAAQVSFLAGDASARRYFRLHRDTGSAVMMDAPRGSCGPYLRMADWLRHHGFAAPQTLARHEGHGLLLIEDLGDDLIARVVERDPDQAGPLYQRIASMLAQLHRHPPAPDLPLLDGDEMATQVGLFAQHYVPAAGGDEAHAAQVAPIIADLWQQLCADRAPVTSLRDFHAENILLTPDNRLGLLDFQDAVATDPAYDLASVLHDARRAIPAEIEAAARAQYLSESGDDPDQFDAAFALMAAQRNLRIMGIFTRLCIRDGKPRYLDFMPHLWSLITRELSHPALARLAAIIDTLPAPTGEVIERIKAQCPTR